MSTEYVKFSVFAVPSEKLWNIYWQIRHVYIHVYCNRNISAYYSKMRGFLSANPLRLSCNVLEAMVLQLISFYTSWLTEKVDKHRDRRGTPRPANMPNWNEDQSDNYLFMTWNTLEMTLMDCYQYTVSQTTVLYLNQMNVHTSSCLKIHYCPFTVYSISIISIPTNFNNNNNNILLIHLWIVCGQVAPLGAQGWGFSVLSRTHFDM